MDQKLINSLWEQSPCAGMLIYISQGEETVQYANLACLKLLGVAPNQIVGKPGRFSLLFSEKNKKRFFLFVEDEKKRYITLDMFDARGGRLYIRFIKNRLESDEEVYILLALQDVTEIQEDAEAFQAGFDDFIQTTTDLEKALATIENQRQLLQKHKDNLEKELEIAHRVQTNLFSLNFERYGIVRVAGFYEAMAELGGDMWEFFESENSFFGVLGDVMGHGVASSLISMAAKTLFKKYFENHAEGSLELSRLCKSLNNDIADVTGRNYFITACVIKIDREFRMEYLTAGHPPLLVVHADRTRAPSLLYTEQPMLGIFEDVEYESASIRLSYGDRVLMYTDCLTESVNPVGVPLNILDIAQIIREGSRVHPKEVIEDILDYRQRFSNSTQLPDDLTMVCIDIPEVPGTSSGGRKKDKYSSWTRLQQNRAERDLKP